LAAHERVFFVFDDSDEIAVEKARDAWKAAKAAGHEVTYWKQDAAGRWQKAG
jgi:DNA polymerase-3 subunit chi